MKNHIYPCIWCNNNAQQIAEFYCEAFPNTKIVQESHFVVMLEIKDQKLMLLNGGEMFQPNPSFSLMYSSSNKDEILEIYKNLKEGGKELMPFGSYDWSESYVWLDDKFGVSWQLYFGKEENIYQPFSPTLMFVGSNNGKAKEASKFYTEIFPNSQLRGMMERADGTLNHGEFLINDFLVMTMDGGFDHDFNFTEGMSLVALCKNQEEIDQYWNALISDGGNESMCGWLKDKYGVSWQIIPENIGMLVNHPKSMEALMKMKKIIISDLENAKDS